MNRPGFIVFSGREEQRYCLILTNLSHTTQNKSPRAKNTDRETAAAGEASADFWGRGRCVVSKPDPTAVNISFLDRRRYFLFQIAPQLSSQG
jgi:hypothetical protein